MDGEFLLPFPSHSHSSLIICALIRNAITVGIFYGLPALQFVLGQQLVSPGDPYILIFIHDKTTAILRNWLSRIVLL